MRCPTLTDLPRPPAGKTGWPWTEESPQLADTMPDGSSWPRVSIVTPSYNQGRFIEETIRSVLLQGYPDLEYIIMDGGSTDDSVEIIRKYEPWLRDWVSERDDGQAAAIGKGFRRTSGELLAWLNSDDRYRPGAMARVARLFAAHPETVFASGDVNFIDGEGNFSKRVYVVWPNRLVTSTLGHHRWPQQGCFWRRQAYERAGGMDSSLRFCMDLDLFIRLTGVGPGRRIPGPPLADFRQHERAKTSTIPDVAQRERSALVHKYAKLRKPPVILLLRLLWVLWRVPAQLRATLQQVLGWEF